MQSWLSYFKNALRRKMPEDPVHQGGSEAGVINKLKKILPMIRNFRGKIYRGGALIFVVSVLGFPVPLITRYLIDDVILAGRMKYLLISVLLITLITLIQKFSTEYQKFYFNRFEQDVTLHIQETLVERLLRYPKSFFDQKDTGYLMSRIITDVAGMRWFFSTTLIYLAGYTVKFVGGVALLMLLKWELALPLVVLIPGMMLVSRFFGRRVKVLSHQSMEQGARVSRNLQESLASSTLIKASSAEKKMSGKIAGEMRELVNLRLENMTVSSLTGMLIGFFPEVARFIVLLTGGYWIIQGEWSLGSLIAFQAYMEYVFGPARFLSTSNLDFQNSMASLERVSALMEVVPEQDAGEGIRADHLGGEIEFRDVSFSYGGDEPVLENISFTVEPGEWIAMAGASGVGKTTLISLLMNFYRPVSGEILFDNIPASQYNFESLRRRFGYVSQDPEILSATIEENLKFGNEDAAREEIERAAEAAGIGGFIDSLPRRYSTRLGERGVNLSQGQRQRLSLARALVRDPDILILDEPTAALDRTTEDVIFENLPEVLKGKTVILISHRPSTIRAASRILFMAESRIVTSGTHEELVKGCEAYRKLAGE